MEERQVHVVEIKAPVADVWAEITKLKQVQKPMFATVLDTDFKPGSRMIYKSPDGKRVFILGEVKEFVPPTRFVHTFRFTNLDETPTLVEWTLEEKAGVTRVTVVHSKFVDQKKTADSVRTSWVDILGNIKSVVETGDVPLKTRFMNGMMSAFMFMAPKDTLVENIPELKDKK
ncbi:MAG: SRPBCC domain-containing protein [Vicinamibacteria bacterium]